MLPNPFRNLGKKPSLSEFVALLGELYPKNYAASWDNIGLLVEPIDDEELKTVFLTNDLTERVCDEAIENEAQLIISYHPPVFRPLKTVRGITGDWKERIVAKCIRNDIAIYSPHTIADAIQDGVNDYLLKCLSVSGPMTSVPIEKDPSNDIVGAGRKALLTNPMYIWDIIAKLKTHLGTNHLRASFHEKMNLGSEVKNIAVCVGSGASILKNLKVDLVITGEMSHHEVLDIVHQDYPCSVILCEHSTSERAYLNRLASMIRENDSGVEVIISKLDREPLETV